MGNTMVRLTRKALYDQVWAEPMATLAGKYGMSDVGLAKICRKNNIPRPGRGYWAKKEFKLEPPVIPLPNPEDNRDIDIREHQDRTPEGQSDLADAQLEEGVPIPETLRSPHPMVRASLLALESCGYADHGLIRPPGRDCLSVHVSKDSRRRAMKIMDGLIKGLESRKYRVSFCKDTAGATAEIAGQHVGFKIDERLEVRKVEQPVGDLTGNYSFRHNAYRQEQVPSGRLCLEISARIYCDTSGLRRQWTDGKRRRVEDQLAGVIAGMVASARRQAEQAALNEARRKEQEAEEQRRRERQRLREELAAKIQEEQDRVDALLQQVENWANSYRLRDYVAAMKAAAERNGEASGPDSDLGRFMNWALRQADRLDPLAKSPPSILDRAAEVAEPDPARSKTWWQA